VKQPLFSAILAGALATAACAPAGDRQHAGTEHGAEQDHAMHGLPATAGPGYTVADVQFMQGMISHHAQALSMAALAPTHGAGAQLLKLAEKIDISQKDEIELMRRWLVERDQAVPDAGHLHDMHMPGMLTAEQFAQLDAARGREFDRLFLTLMIQHHLGALVMTDALFASPGAAQDSDIFAFVTDVGTDQRDEIGVMEYMLDMLDATPGSESR